MNLSQPSRRKFSFNLGPNQSLTLAQERAMAAAWSVLGASAAKRGVTLRRPPAKPGRIELAHKLTAARQRPVDHAYLALCCEDPFEPGAVRELAFPGYERQAIRISDMVKPAERRVLFSFAGAPGMRVVSHWAIFNSPAGGESLGLKALSRPMVVQPSEYLCVPVPLL